MIICITLFLMIIFFCIIVPLLIYIKIKRFRKFFHIAIIPLPIAIFVAFIFYTSSIGGSKDTYRLLVLIMITLSLCAGFGIFFHCFIDRKKKNWMLYIRLLSAFILVINPLLLYFPTFHSLLAPLYFFCGILLGIYGYLTYYQGNKIGLIYVYSSIIFMIVVAVISLAIVKIYLANIKDEIIYRNARFVTCHLPAAPFFPNQEEFVTPTLYASISLFLIGILSTFKKKRLKKRLRKTGVIPREFDEIIASGKRKNE